ncbi:MAG: hypothetical protein KGJ74_13110 [Betaproteobacteria bacterium]|nr:hypothetical protein [Betaproteobacteria bacterium]
MSLVTFVLYLLGIGAVSLVLGVGLALWRGLRPRHRVGGANDFTRQAPMQQTRRRA